MRRWDFPAAALMYITRKNKNGDIGDVAMGIEWRLSSTMILMVEVDGRIIRGNDLHVKIRSGWNFPHKYYNVVMKT